MYEAMTRDDVMRDTLRHVRRVAELMMGAVSVLQLRAVRHDQSKFSHEEFPAFADATPRLRGLTYGSNEYNACMSEIRPAIEHHYRENRHHPEHHANGYKDMTLLDMVEMLADWKAASERHDNGNLRASIDFNAQRFGYGDEITRLLVNTARDMGWIPRIDMTSEVVSRAGKDGES